MPTARLIGAGQLLKIEVLDHVIVTLIVIPYVSWAFLPGIE